MRDTVPYANIDVPWLFTAIATGQPAQYREATVDTRLVPGPLEYGVVLPEGYESAKDLYPLVINLHGGNGSTTI